MSVIRIETLIDGDTLYLPQLKPLRGKTVEIVVTELHANPWPSGGEPWVSPLSGSVISFTQPFEPATSIDQWEANR